MFGACESDPGRRVEHSQSQKLSLFLTADQKHDQRALF